jgi:hypothetical protein
MAVGKPRPNNGQHKVSVTHLRRVMEGVTSE